MRHNRYSHRGLTFNPPSLHFSPSTRHRARWKVWYRLPTLPWHFLGRRGNTVRRLQGKFRKRLDIQLCLASDQSPLLISFPGLKLREEGSQKAALQRNVPAKGAGGWLRVHALLVHSYVQGGRSTYHPPRMSPKPTVRDFGLLAGVNSLMRCRNWHSNLGVSKTWPSLECSVCMKGSHCQGSMTGVLLQD